MPCRRGDGSSEFQYTPSCLFFWVLLQKDSCLAAVLGGSKRSCLDAFIAIFWGVLLKKHICLDGVSIANQDKPGEVPL